MAKPNSRRLRKVRKRRELKRAKRRAMQLIEQGLTRAQPTGFVSIASIIAAKQMALQAAVGHIHAMKFITSDNIVVERSGAIKFRRSNGIK